MGADDAGCGSRGSIGMARDAGSSPPPRCGYWSWGCHRLSGSGSARPAPAATRPAGCIGVNPDCQRRALCSRKWAPREHWRARTALSISILALTVFGYALTGNGADAINCSDATNSEVAASLTTESPIKNVIILIGEKSRPRRRPDGAKSDTGPPFKTLAEAAWAA
jgi:hypothetical protein